MPSKACIIFFCFLFNQQLCKINGKTLPTSNNQSPDVERKSPTTSYYRHNIYGPNTYAYGFEVNDKVSGNIQFRDERRYANGSIMGSYGYVRPDGRVTVTHYMANGELGFLRHTQNFEPGDELKWQANWPTQKPNILMEKPLASIQPTIIYDDNEKLNLTSILLPVEPIKKEHGIDLNPPDLEKELINPVVLEVVNGEAPLVTDVKKKDNSVGFETVNKFIPPDFHIVPFELPQEDKVTKVNDDINKANSPIASKMNATQASNIYDKQKLNNAEKALTTAQRKPSPKDKYVKLQENNAEKSLPSKAIKTSVNNQEDEMKPHQPKSMTIAENIDWYDKVIKQARQEYLENI